jgi:hypothetical protein
MPGQPEVTSGIARLEGYLLCQAELRDARTEAEAFVCRMPWLTADQREEVVRLYTEDRMALSRRTLQRITTRCHELQGEYSARYEQLRRRLLCASLAILLAAVALCALTLLSASRAA